MQATFFSLLLWACSDAKTGEPANTTGGAGAAAMAAGKGGEAGSGPAGQAGLSAAAGNQATGGVGGEHAHPMPTGGSSGTTGTGGVAGQTGAGGEAGAYTPPPCTVVAPTACPDPAPTYADVEPIFTQRCVVCHMGSANGPWPLTNYGHIASWSDDIRAMLLTCTMPPPEERTPLPNAENLAILTWIRCGMPQ
jgi:hypothetical protein